MKTLIGSVLVLALAFPVTGQRIDTQRADRSLVRRVETMANHPHGHRTHRARRDGSSGQSVVQDRTAGQQSSDSTDRRRRHDESFIWTASGRFSYELFLRLRLQRRTFAIDQQSFQREDRTARRE